MARYLCCQRNEKSKWSGQDGPRQHWSDLSTLQTWENMEEFNMQPCYQKAGTAKSLFTESRLLLKHIPFQSIRAHRPLPLHHTVHPFNLTMTKSHLQILNFIILICQVWHLISGFLTCVCLALWRAPFVLRAPRNLAVEEKREWINIYVHYQLLQRQYTEREAIRA